MVIISTKPYDLILSTPKEKKFAHVFTFALPIFYNGYAYIIDEDGEWSLINKDFNKITERGYDEIRGFYYGCAVVKLSDYYDL